MRRAFRVAGLLLFVATLFVAMRSSETSIELEQKQFARRKVIEEQQRRTVQAFCEAYYVWREGREGEYNADQMCFDVQEMKP